MKSNRALEIMLSLLQARKDRSKAVARQASAEHQKAKLLTDQVAQYSNDYDRQWEQTAAQGGTVLDLQARAAFGNQLRLTLNAQQHELLATEHNSRMRLEQAFMDQRRAEILENHLAKKKRQLDLAREKTETRQLEDDRAFHLKR
jgi:flagellar biosynthesis chaperone FliJ